MSFEELPNETLMQISLDTLPDGIATFAALNKRCYSVSADARERHERLRAAFNSIAIGAFREDLPPPVPNTEYSSHFVHPASLLYQISLDPIIVSYIRTISFSGSFSMYEYDEILDEGNDERFILARAAMTERFFETSAFLASNEHLKYELENAVQKDDYAPCIIILLSIVPNVVHLRCLNVIDCSNHIKCLLDFALAGNGLSERSPVFRSLQSVSTFQNPHILPNHPDYFDLTILHRFAQLPSMKSFSLNYPTVSPEWRKVELSDQSRLDHIESVELTAYYMSRRDITNFLLPFAALRTFRFYGSVTSDLRASNPEDKVLFDTCMDIIPGLPSHISASLENLTIMLDDTVGYGAHTVCLTQFTNLKTLKINLACLVYGLMAVRENHCSTHINEKEIRLLSNRRLTKVLPPSIQHLSVCLGHFKMAQKRIEGLSFLLRTFEEEGRHELPMLRNFVYRPGRLLISATEQELWAKITRKLSAAGVQCSVAGINASQKHKGVWYNNWMWSDPEL